MKTFNYRGCRVKYNDNETSEEVTKEFIEDIYKTNADVFENVKSIDASNLDYIKIGSKKYEFVDGRLYDYED